VDREFGNKKLALFLDLKLMVLFKAAQSVTKLIGVGAFGARDAIALFTPCTFSDT
jgi:hypothetical protein